jgi:hypothetical protein
MVRKWQNVDKDSDNPLASQYLVPVGCGENLGSAAMRNLFLRQNQFLRNTKMQLQLTASMTRFFVVGSKGTCQYCPIIPESPEH